MNSILRSTIAAQIGVAIAISVSTVEVAPAQALAINGSATGLSNPAQTIDFNDITDPDGTPITNRYSSAGVTFSDLYVWNISGFGIPNISGRSLLNTDDFATAVNPFAIQFTTPRTSAAFALATGGGNVVFTALLNGTQVESFTASSDNSSNNYYGFTGVTFDQIQIVATGGLGEAAIDNLQIGNAAAPVPFGFMPLPGLAVSGFLCAANRLRKRLGLSQGEGGVEG